MVDRLFGQASAIAVDLPVALQSQLDELVDEFMLRLKQNGSVDQAEKLGRFAELYRAPPEQFFDVANCFLAEAIQQGTTGSQTYVNSDPAFECVIDAYLARDLDTSPTMDRFILDKIEKDIAQGRFVHQQPAEYWLRKLMERDHTSAKAFLDSVLALYDSSPGRTSGLSGMFRSYSHALANNPGNMSLNQPSTARIRPSTTTNTRSRTSPSRRSRAPAGRSRSTRSRGRTRY